MSIDKVIEIGVQVGVKAALDRMEQEKEEKRKSRHDRRLRNTVLLMKNYKNFVIHCKNAVYTNKQLKEQNAIDILDECEDLGEELYVQSIQRTKERTTIIVNHIRTVLSYYKFTCNSELERKRRFDVINGLYLEGKTYQKISEELYCSTKTIERDRKQAIEELSVLIFGIDGLKLET